MKLRLFVYLSVLKISIMSVFATQKVDDDFYVAKILDKPLYLAMERVTPDNLDLWKKYISVQGNPRVSGCGNSLMDPGYKKGICLNDGSGRFKEVLDNVSFHNNDETWIAYVTKTITPEKISIGDIADYHCEYVHTGRNTFCDNLEMYVTVTSSPNASITSHMGIARSVESIVHKTGTRDISIDLHSFAAKVMLERNPMRRYMLNAPVYKMAEIMIDALPNAVFIGTREMQGILKERESAVLDDNFRQQYSNEINSQLKYNVETIIRSTKSKLEDVYTYMIDGKKLTNQQIIKGFESECEKRDDYLIPIEVNGKLELILPSSKEKSILTKIEKYLFRDYKNPFTFNMNKNSDEQTTSLLELMEKNPPMLHVDDGKWIKSRFTIYNHEEPSTEWLTVQKGNPDYSWFFQSIHSPSAATQYMATSLKQLAAARPVEAIKSM